MKWHVQSLLKRATEILKQKGIETARLDAEILLCYVLGYKNRVKLYTNFNRPLNSTEVESYRQVIKRRIKGEPVAYIVGYKDFFGFRFKVKKGALIPRPETETAVEVALKLMKEDDYVVDVGTGSGCIVISICKLFKGKAHYVGLDVSKNAIALARENARILGCKNIRFVIGNLLNCIKRADIIVSNPPYVAKGDENLEENVFKYEPKRALFGGKRGTELTVRLIEQSYERLNSGGYLILEMGIGQCKIIREIMKANKFRDINIYKDLQGIERVITGRKA